MKESRIKRNIEGVILGILLLIPCFSVLGRVLYTQWNHNAKDSYSDYEIQDTILVTTTNNLLIENRDYIWTFMGDYLNPCDYVYFNSISEWVTDLEPNYTIVAFRLTGVSNLVLRDDNGVDHTRFGYFTNSVNKSFNFNYKSTAYPNYLINCGKLLLVDYKKGTLDIAFDYSLQNIVDKYGSGNINFLNWFGNLMFTNPSTLLYCQFANLYLNYCLYINVGYLIYYFFTFFIKMIRRLLDSFIDRRF